MCNISMKITKEMNSKKHVKILDPELQVNSLTSGFVPKKKSDWKKFLMCLTMAPFHNLKELTFGSVNSILVIIDIQISPKWDWLPSKSTINFKLYYLLIWLWNPTDSILKPIRFFSELKLHVFRSLTKEISITIRSTRTKPT